MIFVLQVLLLSVCGVGVWGAPTTTVAPSTVASTTVVPEKSSALSSATFNSNVTVAANATEVDKKIFPFNNQGFGLQFVSTNRYRRGNRCAPESARRFFDLWIPRLRSQTITHACDLFQPGFQGAQSPFGNGFGLNPSFSPFQGNLYGNTFSNLYFSDILY